MFQTKIVEKIKNKFYIQQMFSENRAVYEIMWKIAIEANMAQRTI